MSIITKDTFDNYYTSHPYTDTQVTLAISAAQAAIESYCSRKFDLDSYEEWFYLSSDTVALANYPVSAVASVGTAIIKDGDVTEIDSDAYAVDSNTGLIHLFSGAPSFPVWIQVVYSAGYAPSGAPADLQITALEMAYSYLSGAKTDKSMQSEQFGDYRYTRATGAEAMSAFTNRLNPYRKVL